VHQSIWKGGKNLFAGNGNAGQCEIGTLFNTLVRRADQTQVLKYIVHNVAHSYGKTATFMPKPIVGDNGSGMHVHQSIWKGGKNLFAGNGNAGQCEIGTLFNTLVRRADQTQVLKYCVHNVAHSYGKTATFMPKPIVGDNGSGMHVHQSIWKDGKNLFAGNGYAGLSELALYYIGGIIKHARALNAITNPGTNSYKRLVPGFEAPVKLAYSARNRSASIRIPYVQSDKARRIEVRFPDPTANPYLAFTAMMMAGLDGIQNKIHPGDPADKNLYDLPPEEDAKIPTVCSSLDQALGYLDKDREVLTRGGVFSNEMIDAYIELKMEEVTRFRMTTHPLEYEMYYSI
jgi:glutamine synthetase